MTKTTEKTVAKFLMGLIEQHREHNDPDVPQIMGAQDGSEADINYVGEMGGSKTGLRLRLSDGTKFSINVERML